MAKQYQPKRFFRQVPNSLLEQYFNQNAVALEVGFDQLTETKIEPLYEAWLELPEDEAKKIERDFREIDFLASEGGIKAILDEARWHGEELAETFAEMESFHASAFWTFLNRDAYWTGAVLFHHADTIARSYWRKRKNVPNKPACVDEECIRQLEKTISGYFHAKEGRGKNCKVECYRRNDLDYFYAYPEDYARANIEWVGEEFQRRPHHPAFEVIFVYSQSDGTLDIYLSGDKKPVPDLQKIFAETILKADLGPDKKDEQVYDLNPLKKRDFQFVYDRAEGIEDVLVRKLRLSSAFGKKEKIILEAESTYTPLAIYDLLDKLGTAINLFDYNITQVGLKVFFAPSPVSQKSKTRSFDITYPNSCSLTQDDRDLVIRKMLAASGLEPRGSGAAEGVLTADAI
jgi:hypothetical protein